MIGDQGRSSTLLDKYITEKLDKYIEPVRKGTPKGEEIGLSKEKYKASLYMMYNVRLHELAITLGSSYGVLKKWRTEEQFKSQLKQNNEEFYDRLRIEIEKRIRKNNDELNNFVEKKPLSEVFEKAQDFLIRPTKDDLKVVDYEFELKRYIVKKMVEHNKLDYADDFIEFAYYDLKLINFDRVSNKSATSRDNYDKALTKILKLLNNAKERRIDNLINLFKKWHNLSEADVKEVVIYLMRLKMKQLE